MNENMLRNLIEMQERPGGITRDAFHEIFPDNKETWNDLAELVDAGFAIPRYSDSMLQEIMMTQDALNFLG